MDGYADRPALGQRARELVTDPTTGRTSTRLLPSFETISYRDLWERVGAIATALRNDAADPVNPGDFVATIGFASPDYLTVDLACAYLGLVSVPLQHNAPVSQLRPIIAETEPKVLAVGAEYLDLAVESALDSTSLRHLLVFDYDPAVDDQRDNLERAQARLRDAGHAGDRRTPLAEIIERGRALPQEPGYTGGSDDRLAMIMYTSGSTGTPKGAMFTERTIATLWTSRIRFVDADGPVFNVNFMPLNHLGGRLPLVSSFLAGGTSYFVPESDLSTLFEDWALVRPTDMALVPRVVDMLFQRYRSAVDRLVADGSPTSSRRDGRRDRAAGRGPRRAGDRRIRRHRTAGRGNEDVHRCGPGRAHHRWLRHDGGRRGRPADGSGHPPAVIDYKLVDVPELGYFLTDKPYPRGELLVKTKTMMPGYYKRPEVTAEVFDADGYYRTGDVMAEIEPDRLRYVDRSKNVLKLSQGEFVAVANLEAIFAGAPLVRQIFVYGNSERRQPARGDRPDP